MSRHGLNLSKVRWRWGSLVFFQIDFLLFSLVNNDFHLFASWLLMILKRNQASEKYVS